MTHDPKDSVPRKSDGEGEFEEYLAGKSPVSDGYAKLGAENPPDELDARILAEAERAAKMRPYSYAGKASRWMKPVALAATVLVSFSLVMSIVFDVPTRIEDSFGPGRPDRELRRTDSDSLEPGKGRANAHEDELATLAETFGDIAEELDANRALGMVAAPEPEPKMETIVPAQLPAATMAVETSGAESAETNRLSLIMDVIRERQTQQQRQQDGISPADKKVSNGSAKSLEEIVVTSLPQSRSPEARLQEILSLYDDNQTLAATEAIEEFRRSYPEHPVSVALMERGF